MIELRESRRFAPYMALHFESQHASQAVVLLAPNKKPREMWGNFLLGAVGRIQNFCLAETVGNL